MKKFVLLLIFSVVIASCGSKQPKPLPTQTAKKDTIKTTPVNEYGMWKISNYATSLGNNRNSSYITNTYAVWGTFSNNTNDKAELKVKFVIDKETFCIKLLEYGTTPVRKGDENLYKITVKTSDNGRMDFTAKNVSDRLFIKSTDALKIGEMFNKAEKIYFYMVTDSKSSPAIYSFTIDNPVGFGDAYQKITN
jgi:predicted small lipoprotein YifL